MKKNKVDKPFLIIVLTLVLFGFFIFSSAALGLAARDGINYFATIWKQFLVGVLGGLIFMFAFSKINHNFFKKYSPILFFLALLLNVIVLIPAIGIEHGGARRWLSFGGFSFQPSELLKISTVLFLAAWFNKYKSSLKMPFFGLISVGATFVLVSIPLLLQPDFDAIILIIIPVIAMYLVAKAPIKQAVIMGVVLMIILILVGTQFNHVKSRLNSFIDQSENSLTTNYQIQQSLIAIGSGQVMGHGFGKSVQKFKYLPEPTGDSIFAVYGEEFGFVGAVFLILLYVAFAVRGFYIASRARTLFGGLFVTGIITLFIFQSLANIASMLGLLPVLGLPLIFVSLGGTSLLVSLAMVGIILNISKDIKKD